MNGLALCPFNVLELCAGVGGLGLGIHVAVPSARTIAYVEREAYAAATLVARMAAGDLPEALVWSDLATFDGRRLRGLVDCVASGDPCQPNSVAGKRGGAADDRFLIDQVLRIVDESRPFRLFRENVTGNADGQLAALVPALEAMGYRVAAGIFSAAEIGGAHRRERLFVMADSTDGRRRQKGHRGQRPDASAVAGPAMVDSVGARRKTAGAGPSFDPRPQPEPGSSHLGCALADANVARPSVRPDNQVGQTIVGEQGQAPGTGRGDLLFAPGPTDRRWSEILAAIPSLEPALCRMANGLADRVDQLRACGNGVVSVAAARAWLALDALHGDARRSAGESVLTGAAA